MASPEIRPRRVPPRAVWAGWATGLALLGAFAVGASHLGEGQRFAALLQAARPSWLLAAAGLQAATYVCAAGVWECALRRGGAGIPLRGLVPLGLAKLFADQALPSAGISGTVLVANALRRRSVPRSLAVAVLLASLASFYVAYALAVGAALAVLWWHGELHRWLVALAGAFATLAAGVPLAVLWLRGRAQRLVPRWARRLPGVDEALTAIADVPTGAILAPGLLARTTTLQLAIFLLDAATLWVLLRALATPAEVTVVFASFVVASFVATLAWVPGGLGAFEGSCAAMLHLHGVSLEAAVAATLLLRGFTFWLPMAPGLWLARRELRGAPLQREHRRGTDIQ